MPRGLGRSRSGLNIEIHVATDGATDGLRHQMHAVHARKRADITQGHALIDGSAAGAVAADKGYDADHFVEIIELAVAEAATPPKASRKVDRPSDRALYTERILVERIINTIKHSKRVATQYDKVFADYRGFVLLAAIATLLR